MLPARGVVWGVDLRGLTRGAARSRLRRAAKDAARDAEDSSGAAHLVIVFVHDAPTRAAAYWRLGESLATRLHAQLMRRSGREWDVIVVDASDCDDGGLLRARLLEAISSPAGSVGDTAVDWGEIRAQPIHRAAAGHAL